MEVKQKTEYIKKAEGFNKKMNIAYSKEQIDFLLELTKKIIHYFYEEEKPLEAVLKRAKIFLKEIRDDLKNDKTRYLTIDNFIWSRLGEDIDLDNEIKESV